MQQMSVLCSRCLENRSQGYCWEITIGLCLARPRWLGREREQYHLLNLYLHFSLLLLPFFDLLTGPHNSLAPGQSPAPYCPVQASLTNLCTGSPQRRFYIFYLPVAPKLISHIKYAGKLYFQTPQFCVRPLASSAMMSTKLSTLLNGKPILFPYISPVVEEETRSFRSCNDPRTIMTMSQPT